MALRRFLLSSVVFSAFALTGIQAQAAVTVLKPNTSWSVSKVASRSAGGSDYCAMARKFTDNIVLTLARNASDESSLALDFQAVQLNPGQSYYVVLDPGHGQNRAFDVRPVSGKAMVIRMGQDFAFHDALGRSGALDIEVSGKKYSFEMNDIAKGQQDMNGCLANLVRPAAGKPVPELDQTASISRPAGGLTPEPLPAEEISAGPDENTAALEMLRDENSRLKNALARERRQYEERFMDQGEGSSKVAELAEKVQALQTERDDLSFKLAEALNAVAIPAAGALSSAQESESLKSDIARLREENEQLRRDVSGREPVEPLRQALDKLTLENTRLQQEIASRAPVASLQLEIDALRHENAGLKQQIAAVPLESIRAELAQVREENDSLKIAQAAQEPVEPLKIQVNALREENLKLREQMAAAPAAESLKAEIVTLREMNKALQARLDAQPDVGAMQTELSQVKEVKDKLAQQVAMTESAAPFKKEIERLKAENDALTKLQSELIQIRAEKDALSQKLAAMEPVEPLKAEIVTLKSQLAARPSDEVLAELGRIKAENEILKREMSGKDSATGSLNEQIASLRLENEKLKLDLSSQKALTAEIEQRTATAYTASEKDAGALAALEARLDELTADNARLQSELAAAQNTTAVTAGVTSAQLDALTARARQAEELLQAAVAERDSAAQKLEDLLKQGEDGRLSISSANWDLEQATRRFNEAEREIVRLGTVVEKERAQCSVEKKKIEAMLFDPAISDDMQRAKLKQLETELTLARAELAMARDTSSMSQPVAPVSREAVVSAPMTPLPESMPAIETAAGSASPVMAEPMMPPPAVVASAPMPVPAPSPVVSSAAAAVSGSLGAVFMTPEIASALLRQAGLPLTAAARQVEDAASPDFSALSWESGALFGSAEQSPLPAPSRFEGMVQAYLKKTESRCGGEFAAVPGGSGEKDGVRYASYEIACIMPEAAGASAALLFYSRDGVFTTMAHEAGMDMMSQAMDARDRVLQTVLPVSMAKY